MEEFNSAWAWLGGEIARFGFRWLVVVIPLLGFGGWFGWRYREMKRRVSSLERGDGRTQIINAPVVHGATVHVHTDGTKTEARRIGKVTESITGPTIMGRYDQDNKAIYINTIHGRLAIRVNDPNATMSDLTNWLDKWGGLEPLDDK